MILARSALLFTVAWAAPSLAQEAPPTPEAPSTAETPVPEPDPVDETAVPDAPPLSTYDRLRQQNEQPLEEERSLTGQLLRTVFALAIVVGLIYLVFKLGLGRLLQGGGVPGLSSSNREIKIVERTVLDGKNAVIMLELGGGRRILVGTGERGVTYLCDVDPSQNGTGAVDSEPQRTFSDVLQGNAKEHHEA